MEINQEWFDHKYRDPVRADLYAHELAVVDRFHDRWAEWDILELGCGDGRVAWTVGAISGANIELLSGLQAGDRIAIAGVSQLRDGMRVRDLGDGLGVARQ